MNKRKPHKTDRAEVFNPNTESDFETLTFADSSKKKRKFSLPFTRNWDKVTFTLDPEETAYEHKGSTKEVRDALFQIFSIVTIGILIAVLVGGLGGFSIMGVATLLGLLRLRKFFKDEEMM